MSRRRIMSLSALTLAAYLAGRREGRVAGEVDGTLRTARALVAAAVKAR